MKKGLLIVITGCMFSGKTTKLINLAQKAIHEGKNIDVFYPEIDTRYRKNYITSHDKLQLNSTPLPITIEAILDTGKNIIFIDEVHFFQTGIIAAIEKLLHEGVDVVIGGLDRNFRAEAFPITEALMKFADQIIVLKAKCNICSKDATYTYRVNAKKDDATIVVGGADMYEARCHEHYIKPE
jgi:thymidine kinase